MRPSDRRRQCFFIFSRLISDGRDHQQYLGAEDKSSHHQLDAKGADHVGLSDAPVPDSMMDRRMQHAEIRADHGEVGFTLIELLVGMAMGLLILAGLTSVFIAMNNASRGVASRSERMGDLYLASHVMQADMRESLSVPDATTTVLTNLSDRGVSNPGGYPASDATFTQLPYWDAASKTLTYQNIDGNVGIFQYQRISNDRIYWLRPLAAGMSGSATFQELIRDLNTVNGLTASTTSDGRVTVTLMSTYTNEEKQSKDLTLTFKTWPRN